MTLTRNEDGSGELKMSPEEYEWFLKGASVVKESGDRYGIFTVTARLKRPRRLEDRFPESIYGKDYHPDPNAVSARVILPD